MPTYRDLQPGDPAPWFTQRSPSNPAYHFDSVAGRYIVLCFYGSAAHAAGQARLNILRTHRALFDDDKIAFFGVSIDPGDETEKRVQTDLPGVRYFWDFDGRIGRLYGVAAEDGNFLDAPVRGRWVVIDPMLRVRAVLPFAADARDCTEIADYLAALPATPEHAGISTPPPVLILPNVFDPALCASLIERYKAHGGIETGVMRDHSGKSFENYDHATKKRSDHRIEDAALIAHLRERILRRVAPEIFKAHQFKVTQIERFIVGCYEGGGHFRPHRDNTTKAGEHRRFAMSINLNDDFEGGALSFPEFAQQSFKMPAGCAAVFSCSLLHTVSPVTSGARYAFLPFLHDDESAALRERNFQFFDDSVKQEQARRQAALEKPN